MGMAKTADEFLNDLAGRGLVADSILASLRRQVATAKQPVTSAALAKLLVDKGHLTAAQAQAILGGGGSKSGKPAWKTPAPEADLMPLDDLTPLDEPASLEELTSLQELTPLDELPPLGTAGGMTSLAAKPAPLADIGTAVVPIDEPLAAMPARTAPVAPPQPAGKKKSSLGLVLGVLAVGAFVAAGAAAWLLIPRGKGEEEFAAALADYDAKAYDAAIAKYDMAIAQYPRSPRAPAARVRRAASRVFAAKASAGGNWTPVLAAATDTLPSIADEPSLAEVQGDLAPLLMEMAAELANEAEQAASNEQNIASARAALALADDGRFVPGAVRQWQRLQFAAEAVARAEQSVGRTKALQAAVEAIKTAADAGDVQAAYDQRLQLLSAYAGLATDPDLRDLGPGLAAAAAAKVQASQYSSESQTSDAPSAIAASIALVSSAKPAAMGGSLVPLSFAGSAWSIDSASGSPRWRRYTGGSAAAVPVDSEADRDLLLTDAQQASLLRVARADGAIRWRQPIDGSLAGEPVIAGQSVFAVTRSGQVLSLAADSGGGQHTAQLPQRVRVGPAAAASGQHLIVTGDHSLVYVLKTADLNCERAVFVGHDAGGAVVPPTVLPKHLVLTENRGVASSVLHILVLDNGGLPKGVVQRIELVGQVLAPPAVLEGRLVVATDAGSLYIYESAADPADGMKEAARAEAGTAGQVARHLVVHQGKLLVAGDGLRRFAPPSGDKLKEEWSGLAGEVLLGPPQIAGDALVVASTKAGRPGIAVTGVTAADGKAKWETLLADPIVSLSRRSDGKVALVSQSGRLAEIDLSQAGGSSVQRWQSPAGEQSVGSPAGGPIAWRDGEAVVSGTGQVAWLDPQTRAPKAQPLQLALAPGGRIAHCRLGVVGEQAGPQSSELIVFEGQRVARIGIATEPSPSLVLLATATLESPATTQPIVGDGVVGLLNARGKFVTLALSDLKPTESREFPGRAITAGPVRIAAANYLASDQGELFCLNGTMAQTWRVPLSRGPLAGAPAADAAGLVVATRSGWICRLNRDTGQEIAQVDLGQPLVAGPIVIGSQTVGSQIVAAAADGTLLVAELPAGKGSEP
jgi:outer membrane protein assembly factor BamB